MLLASPISASLRVHYHRALLLTLQSWESSGSQSQASSQALQVSQLLTFLKTMSHWIIFRQAQKCDSCFLIGVS